jgi:hypothetical protein
MRHKDGREVLTLCRAFLVTRKSTGKQIRLIGTQIDITVRRCAEKFDEINTDILKMIARGHPASSIYDTIAIMVEERHPGMRCSLL